MILTAHQPVFLPWPGLIAKIAAADQFVSFDAVPFERHGYGNRVQIKTHSGIQWLTVPVRLEDHLSKPCSEIEIVPGNWQRKHLRTVEIAYAKAPHFKRYFEGLQAVYGLREWWTLAGFNAALLDWILEELGIGRRIEKASEMGFEGQKSGLVLDMCLKLGAKKYIFGSQGRDYADTQAFREAGVEPVFQAYTPQPYPQLHGEFVGGLSVLDVLMNCGPGSLDVILAGHREEP